VYLNQGRVVLKDKSGKSEGQTFILCGSIRKYVCSAQNYGFQWTSWSALLAVTPITCKLAAQLVNPSQGTSSPARGTLFGKHWNRAVVFNLFLYREPL